MPLNFKELEKAVVLIEKSELNNAIQETKKGAAVFGISVFACSVCLGPVGTVCGGIVGGLAASAICSDFDSLSNVIRNKLSDGQKEEMLETVNKAIEGICIEDALALLQYMNNNPHILAKILNLLRLFGINVSPNWEMLCSKMISHVG